MSLPKSSRTCRPYCVLITLSAENRSSDGVLIVRYPWIGVRVAASSQSSMRLHDVSMSSLMCPVALWSGYPHSSECPLKYPVQIVLK